MWKFLRHILTGETTEERLSREIENTINFDDPNQRIGADLYLILTKQFDLIGKPEGELPFVAPFASDKARGALLGTAIAVSRQHHGKTDPKSIIDAAITAFALAYGTEVGRKYALHALQESSDGENSDLSSAAEWALKDTEGSFRDDSVATPVAFYFAVAEMI